MQIIMTIGYQIQRLRICFLGVTARKNYLFLATAEEKSRERRRRNLENLFGACSRRALCLTCTYGATVVGFKFNSNRVQFRSVFLSESENFDPHHRHASEQLVNKSREYFHAPYKHISIGLECAWYSAKLGSTSYFAEKHHYSAIRIA